MAALYTSAVKSRLPATLLLLSLFILFPSCVTSLYLLTEEDSNIVVRDELVGTWREWGNDTRGGENGNYALVTKADSFYRIKVVMESTEGKAVKDTSYFVGVLVQVDGYLFLNCLADMDHPTYDSIGEYAKRTLTPTNFICSIVFRNQNEVVELWELGANEDLQVALDSLGASYYAESRYATLLTEPTARLEKLLVRLIKEHPEVWYKRLLLKSEPAPALIPTQTE